jgi:adenylate kinase
VSVGVGVGVVVVFGVSGVGKTTACRSYISRHHDVFHVSAGDLLKKVSGRTGEGLRLATSSDIQQNQNRLGPAFEDWRSDNGAANVLIDAHSIIDNNRELIQIPVEVIRSLNPSAMVLLEASPEVITKRRESDCRSRPTRSMGEIREQLLLSRELCLNYERELNVPLEIGVALQDDDFDLLVLRAAARARSPR